MNDDRFNELVLMNIHRDILETVKPTKVLTAFIDKNIRKIELNIFNRFRVYLSSFFNKQEIIIKCITKMTGFLYSERLDLISLYKLYF